MRVADLNWMQLEDYLANDDRIILPLGSTEQHAYLSLETDNALAERVSVEAAEPLGVPVLPVLAYGVTPRFAAYPGSPSISRDTYVSLLLELTASLEGQGFGRILLVNGHGGNSFAAELVIGDGVRWHDWWNSPKIRALVDEIDSEGSHASWMENFPWTRLEGVALPQEHKANLGVIEETDPVKYREIAGDGSFGGWYERPDEEMLRIWNAGVAEVRELLESGWRKLAGLSAVTN